MTHPLTSPTCFFPGCTARAPYGFRWGDRARHACREHRAEAQTWLDGVKRAGATYTADEHQAAGPGRLL